MKKFRSQSEKDKDFTAQYKKLVYALVSLRNNHDMDPSRIALQAALSIENQYAIKTKIRTSL